MTKGSVTGRRTVVTDLPRVPGSLNDRWAGYAVLADYWMQTKFMEGYPILSRIPRKAGIYVDEDFFSFLACHFSCEPLMGIHGFSDACRGETRALAGLMERENWPTQSSFSRFLARAEPEHVRQQRVWLLREALSCWEIFNDPGIIYRDALGESFHLMDIDGTVNPFRRRCLPEGEDLPPPQRRTEAMNARPGYSGRKRSDVQWTRVTTQLAGAGSWHGAYIYPGNAARGYWVEECLDDVAALSDSLGIPRHRMVTRTDGYTGHAWEISEHDKRNLGYLTRLVNYELLNRELLRWAAGVTWTVVSSSTSGTTREALDLGRRVISGKYPGEGGHVEARPRVVLTRFPTHKKRGAGKFIDGYQYELFGCSLDGEALPAADMVQAYFGRGGFESRFGHEDREVDFDHLYSENNHGQAWANQVGMFVWNLQIELAYRAQQQPSQPAPLEPRPQETAVAKSADDQTDVETGQGLEETKAAHIAESIHTQEIIGHGQNESPAKQPESKTDSVRTEQTDGPEFQGDQSRPDREHVPEQAGNSKGKLRRGGRLWTNASAQVRVLLIALFVRMELSHIRFPRPFLTWLPDEGIYRCPAGRILVLALVKNRHETGKDLIFRITPSTACAGCPDHVECGRPNKPPHRREVAVRVADKESDELLQIVASLDPPPLNAGLAETTDLDPLNVNEASLSPASAIPSGMAANWEEVAYDAPDAGPYVLSPPCFLPAEHRSYLLRHLRRVRVHVDVNGKPEPRARFPDVESVWVAREHRRLTWTRRKSVNQLPATQSVVIAFQGLGQLAPLVNSWQPGSLS